MAHFRTEPRIGLLDSEQAGRAKNLAAQSVPTDSIWTNPAIARDGIDFFIQNVRVWAELQTNELLQQYPDNQRLQEAAKVIGYLTPEIADMVIGWESEEPVQDYASNSLVDKEHGAAGSFL